jgi:paraquat-inducible protein B
MGKRVNPALVGAFMLGAIGLIVTAVVLFGSGNLFHKTHEFVIYFSGDISGLQVAAPVRFKGVEIGQVKRIRLWLKEARQNGKFTELSVVPVIIELDEEKIVRSGGIFNLSDPDTISNLVKEGMRAQLQSDSFVTGVSFVALIFVDPKVPPVWVAKPGTLYPRQEIPAIPTTLEQAQAVAIKIFTRLDKVDFDKLFSQMTDTLDSIDKIASSPGLREAISKSEVTREQLSQALGSTRQTLENLDSQIKPVSNSFQKTSGATDAAVKQARATLGTVQTTIEPGSPVNYQIVQTLQDVSAAARSIKELADFLQRDPSAVVRGRDLSQTTDQDDR